MTSRRVRARRLATAWRASYAALGSVVGVAVGYTTNIVTSGSAHVAMIWGFAAAVISTVLMTIRQAITDARTERAELEARRARLLLAFAGVPDDLGTPTVVSLLDPAASYLPFQGRSHEQHELLAWCAAKQARIVRVIDGASGVGKTRLAAELTRQVPEGWVAGWVAPGTFVEALDAVRACGDPALIVVDDADTQPEIRELLARLAADPRSSQVRVMLTVRHAETFTRWLARPGSPVSALGWDIVHLEVTGEASDRKRWFVAALHEFARKLGKPEPTLTAETVGPVGTDGEPMLVTLLRAALAADHDGTRAAVHAVRMAGTGELAARLVEHERERWDRSAEDPSWAVRDIAPTVRTDTVLALVLTGPTSEPNAVAVLARLRLWTAEAIPRAVVAWARYLYPGPNPTSPALVAPVPDFLTSALVTVCAEPDRVTTVDRLDLPSVADRPLVTRLLRAATVFPQATALLNGLLDCRFGLAAMAAEAAVLAQVDPLQVEALLVRTLDAATPTAEEVERLRAIVDEDEWPFLRVAVLRQAVVHELNEPERIRALADLGAALVAVGWYREALEVYEEAKPGAHALGGPLLVDLLLGLAEAQYEFGNYRDALAASRAAVDLARALPDERVWLATALQWLGLVHLELGDIEPSETELRQSMALFRALYAVNETRYCPDLAWSLKNFARTLTVMGEVEEAISTLREAVDLHGRYVGPLTTRDQGVQAVSLARLVFALRHGHNADEEQLAYDRQAVALARPLAARLPDRYTWLLGATLQQQGVTHSSLSQHIESDQAFTEALGLIRQVAEANPNRHLATLALATANRFDGLRRAGLLTEALAVGQQALTLYRRLFGNYPATYAEDVARTLANLALVFLNAGRLDDAETLLVECNGLLDEPGTAPLPRSYMLYYVHEWLARVYEGRGEHELGLITRAEAVAHLSRLAHLQPNTYVRLYVGKRSALAQAFAVRGHPLGAALVAERDAAERLGFGIS